MVTLHTLPYPSLSSLFVDELVIGRYTVVLNYIYRRVLSFHSAAPHVSATCIKPYARLPRRMQAQLDMLGLEVVKLPGSGGLGYSGTGGAMG